MLHFALATLARLVLADVHPIAAGGRCASAHPDQQSFPKCPPSPARQTRAIARVIRLHADLIFLITLALCETKDQDASDQTQERAHVQ